MTSQLVVGGVPVSYPGRPVLERVSPHIPPGEHVGVIGDNGSGKTTPLRVLAGELVPDSGWIRLPERVGRRPQDVPAAASRQALPAAFAGTRREMADGRLLPMRRLVTGAWGCRGVFVRAPARGRPGATARWKTGPVSPVRTRRTCRSLSARRPSRWT